MASNTAGVEALNAMLATSLAVHERKAFTTIQDFLLNVPLYAERLVDDKKKIKPLYFGTKFDGHCMQCRTRTTYTASNNLSDQHFDFHHYNGNERFRVTLECARDADHKVEFFLYITGGLIQKVGQFPSLADIANDESKAYSSVLKGTDARELHTAIGLAAHGVGIGSYVYLRRVFEHLIKRRFDEHKAAQGWKDSEFATKHMDEKISLLQDHLPPFLVKNKKIYSILSLGIHELEEDECRSFFPVLRQSTITILEEDRQAALKKRSDAELEKAISQFTPRSKGRPEAG